MTGQIVKNHQIISVKQLVKAVQEGKINAERFCFIIGSDASVIVWNSDGCGVGISMDEGIRGNSWTGRKEGRQDGLG